MHYSKNNNDSLILKYIQKVTFILTLDSSNVIYIVRTPETWHIYLFTTKKGRILMGAILDVVEMLKEPAGMIGAVVVIAAGYFFVKWVFAEHPDDE